MRYHCFKFFLFLTFFVAITSCKSDDDNNSASDPAAENKKSLGTSSQDILSSDTFKSMTVEFVFEPTSRPSETAIQNFKDFINAHVNKPAGISYVETNIESPSGAPYSISEIREIEDEVRTQYTQDDDIAIFVYFPVGRAASDTQTTVTLGTAYRNTSVVIFESTLRILSQNNQELLPIFESTTLHHEFGHILGLTNILNDDIHQDHEDSANEKHCMVEDCLMYFDATSVTEDLLQQMVRRASIPQLDPLCIADLEAKGGM